MVCCLGISYKIDYLFNVFQKKKTNVPFWIYRHKLQFQESRKHELRRTIGSDKELEKTMVELVVFLRNSLK